LPVKAAFGCPNAIVCCRVRKTGHKAAADAAGISPRGLP
jgi:hypothetical protein